MMHLRYNNETETQILARLTQSPTFKVQEPNFPDINDTQSSLFYSKYQAFSKIM